MEDGEGNILLFIVFMHVKEVRLKEYQRALQNVVLNEKHLRRVPLVTSAAATNDVTRLSGGENQETATQ